MHIEWRAMGGSIYRGAPEMGPPVQVVRIGRLWWWEVPALGWRGHESTLAGAQAAAARRMRMDEEDEE